MNRPRFIEIHEQRWCPATLRDAATDFLQHLAGTLGYFAVVLPRLRAAIGADGPLRIVDLASGGGGPWLGMLRRPTAVGVPEGWSILLTDLYPNTTAFQRARLRSGGRIAYVGEPVDATRVPAAIDGPRTIFGALHHFDDRDAAALLRDAVARRAPIAAFEPQERRPLSLLSICLLPLGALLLTPFIRPFRWSRLAWTYLLPLAPLVIWYDGLVSCVRTRSPAELRRLVEAVDAPGYRWQIGRQRMRGLPLAVTYLVGTPDG